MKYENQNQPGDGWRNAYLHWQIAHVVGVTLPTFIFWFAPEDVLTSYPMLANITGVMKEWIPSVRKMAEFSTFPQVAELGMSAIFICALFMIPVIYFGKTLRSASGSGFIFPADPRQRRKFWFVVVVGLIAYVGMFTMGPDTSVEAAEILDRQTTRLTRLFVGVFITSRFMSGVMASLYTFTLAGYIVVVYITLFKHFMDGLRRDNNG